MHTNTDGCILKPVGPITEIEILGIIEASFFTGLMPFLPPNYQCKSTKENIRNVTPCNIMYAAAMLPVQWLYLVWTNLPSRQFIQTVSCIEYKIIHKKFYETDKLQTWSRPC